MSTADGSVLGNTQIYGGAPRNRAFVVYSTWWDANGGWQAWFGLGIT